MSEIHPTAFVDPQAELAAGVRVGPLAYVGPQVQLGEDCVVHPHATVLGPSTFGRANVFFPHCTIGAAPQDLKFKGGATRLVVGDHNIFRESVTVHRGTEIDRQSNGTTRIGNHGLFMVGVHVAHDCEIGNHVILANNVLLAGHVSLEDRVTVGGGSAMHHYVTVGRFAFVGGMTRITHDAPPYMKLEGYDQEVRAVNVTGLKRSGTPAASVAAVKAAFRRIYPRRAAGVPGRMVETLQQIEGDGLIEDPHVRYLVDFLRRKLEVGVYGRVREARRSDVDADRSSYYRPVGHSRPSGSRA